MSDLFPPIDRFVGEYAFLSNFYPCDIVYHEEKYPSVEHAYQAWKSEDERVRMEFATGITTLTAGQAKRLGRNIELRPQWNKFKLILMTELIDIKFNQRYFSDKLVNTSPRELIEGNWWGDTFWGQCNGVGNNNLGKILMNKREKLIMENFYE